MQKTVLLMFALLSFELSAKPQRIISLAPHTTEMVYALNAGSRLIAVSDYSDYPSDAKQLPSVASYNGVDFEKILTLEPDLIIAWKGGNKPQDLNKLESLGLSIFYSNPQTPEDVGAELEALGELLGNQQQAGKVSHAYLTGLASLRTQYRRDELTPVFYYMWPQPLMSIGKGAWANQLLNLCGARSIFDDVSVDYPEVNLQDVINRRPQILIAAMKTNLQDAQGYWNKFNEVLSAKLLVVNPDRLHRFTPRLLDGLQDLCEQLNL